MVATFCRHKDLSCVFFSFNFRHREAKIYQYYLPDHSKDLLIGVFNRRCLSTTGNCSLEIAISPKRFPTNMLITCKHDKNACGQYIKWPQVNTNYYIAIRGINMAYEISAEHTGLYDFTFK